MLTIQEIRALAERKILILDGAMGTMLQAGHPTAVDFNGGEFASHPVSLVGDNDVLNLTRPDLVKSVHRAYLDAGADIIETNTFNSNRFSQLDYGLEERVYDLAYAGTRNAREVADEFTARDPSRPRLVAGSVGPTGRTAGMSSDVEDPAARNVTFDELADTYRTAMEAMLDAGADLLLVETVFDTLNCKAALFAAEDAMASRGREVPVMVSATLSDASGRLLSGQCAEAFLISVSHARCLFSVGFNCALGAEELRPHIEEMSAKSPFLVSAHPNAGLPDVEGKYTQTPEQMASVIRSLADAGHLNIAGGCCGTTPAHIAAIAKILDGVKPRVPSRPPRLLRLSGLNAFTASRDKNFINVGERTNVAGSRKFLNIVKADDMPGAMAIARHQIENGAAIIDVNMDDALLDAPAAMKRFLLYAAGEPDVASVPFMIDSSNWEVVRTALRCVPGRSIVNSISLKEGEEPFLAKAREIRRLGAAVLVMAFDEKGQADRFERRIETLSRSVKLLTEQAGFAEEDIVLDPNVFAVATGIAGHDDYAADFIRSVGELHRLFPLCGISGGISNVSFSFRGNDAVRGAIHTVFLKHAIDAGLTMGIVNAAQLGNYDAIPPELRDAVEAVVLNTSPGAGERLLELAAAMKNAVGASQGGGAETAPEWRTLPLAERIAASLVRGDDSFVDSDMAEALAAYPDPMAIVEGPLMDGMRKTGELFGAGKMFLPQVVKTARVMKRAVAILMPVIEASRASSDSASHGPVGVFATVKGDVHDIGKNIVSVVLQCNNCTIHDLGVMVPANEIADAAEREHADFVGLSGLITPSLDEMARTVAEFERRGLKTPILVGGAATSALHTALKLQPLYSGPVIHTTDASDSAVVVNTLMNPDRREAYLASVRERYAELAGKAGKRAVPELIPYAEACAKASREKPFCPVPRYKLEEDPDAPEVESGHDFNVSDLSGELDWDAFARAWKTPVSASSDLVSDAKKRLAEAKFSIQSREGIFPVKRLEGDSFKVFTSHHRTLREDGVGDSAVITFPRAQTGDCRSLADFIGDWLGMFVVSVRVPETPGDDYVSLLDRTLANFLADAAASKLFEWISTCDWGWRKESDPPSGIAPAPGYPVLPDHSLKREIFHLLDLFDIQDEFVELTENFMMSPASSTCAFVIPDPRADYRALGPVGDDQIAALAEARGFSVERMKELLARPDFPVKTT